MESHLSWGRSLRYEHAVAPLSWLPESLPYAEGGRGPLLPYAYGRSYGDCCLNDRGVLLDTRGLDRFIAFDPESGIVRCEAGVSLAEIVRVFLPRGWFLPVTPGTKYVSVGGAIANDVHGKNHHRAGTFGCHVRRFELLRSDGTRLECSPTRNAEFFRATIGGLGLTGLITWAEVQLKAVESPYLDVETVKFANLDEFFALSDTSDDNFEYTVAWVDCLARGPQLGRGLFLRGAHAPATAAEPLSRSLNGHGRLNVPIDLPSVALNHWTVQLFNTLYYGRQRAKVRRRHVHYDPFFYPLDAIGHWNRIYGKPGFYQYQCVLPRDRQDVIYEILDRIAVAGSASFLAVMKEFGDRPSPGILSFPMPGLTLALDFANRGAPTQRLFAELDALVVEHGGRLYPAKDACMSAATFQAGFPAWRQFTEYIDPKFSSSFWRRVRWE